MNLGSEYPFLRINREIKQGSIHFDLSHVRPDIMIEDSAVGPKDFIVARIEISVSLTFRY